MFKPCQYYYLLLYYSIIYIILRIYNIIGVAVGIRQFLNNHMVVHIVIEWRILWWECVSGHTSLIKLLSDISVKPLLQLFVISVDDHSKIKQHDTSRPI